MTTIDPVIDPTSDYDIFDPQYLLDPFPTIEQIRQSSCPVAHTERWGGSWMPTRYADIVAVAQEHDVFTSAKFWSPAHPMAKSRKVPTQVWLRRPSAATRQSTTGTAGSSCRSSRRRRWRSTSTSRAICATS